MVERGGWIAMTTGPTVAWTMRPRPALLDCVGRPVLSDDGLNNDRAEYAPGI